MRQVRYCPSCARRLKASVPFPFASHRSSKGLRCRAFCLEAFGLNPGAVGCICGLSSGSRVPSNRQGCAHGSQRWPHSFGHSSEVATVNKICKGHAHVKQALSHANTHQPRSRSQSSAPFRQNPRMSMRGIFQSVTMTSGNLPDRGSNASHLRHLPIGATATRAGNFISSASHISVCRGRLDWSLGWHRSVLQGGQVRHGDRDRCCRADIAM